MKNFRNEIYDCIDGMDQIQKLTYMTALMDSIESTMAAMYDSMEPGATCYYDMIAIRELRTQRDTLKEMIEIIVKD